MKLLSLLLLFLLSGIHVSAQNKYITKEGRISFFSHTVLEDITAKNNEVAGILDSETGELVIHVIMTAFHFEKRLMEEHFNENYVESEKYPKSIFKGMILNNNAVDYTVKGSYEVEVEGELTIHGVTNDIKTAGTIIVDEKKVITKTKFLLNPEDYDIKIPKVVRKNLSERMEITVDMSYSPM